MILWTPNPKPMAISKVTKRDEKGNIVKPSKVSLLNSTYTSDDYIEPEAAPLSQGAFSAEVAQNSDRAAGGTFEGEVVGIDSSSGESLVRSPGGSIKRVSTPDKVAPGTTVRTTSAPRKSNAAYEQIRAVGVSVHQSGSLSSGKTDKGGSRVSFSISTSIPEAGLLSDPCTPPDVREAIISTAAMNGVYLNSEGKSTSFWAASASWAAYGKGGSQQTLPANLSTNKDTGVPTLSQQYSSGLPKLFKCVDGTCVESDEGFYPTRELCEENCGIKTWNCQGGSCVAVSGPSGQYKTLEECQAAGCNSNYECVAGDCVPSKTGRFGTLEACLASGCYQGYSCVSGECVPTQGGLYRSLACCQSQCSPLGLSAIFVPKVAISDTLTRSLEWEQPALSLRNSIGAFAEYTVDPLVPNTIRLHRDPFTVSRGITWIIGRKDHVTFNLTPRKFIRIPDSEPDLTPASDLSGFVPEELGEIHIVASTSVLSVSQTDLDFSRYNKNDGSHRKELKLNPQHVLPSSGSSTRVFDIERIIRERGLDYFDKWFSYQKYVESLQAHMHGPMDPQKYAFCAPSNRYSIQFEGGAEGTPEAVVTPVALEVSGVVLVDSRTVRVDYEPQTRSLPVSSLANQLPPNPGDPVSALRPHLTNRMVYGYFGDHPLFLGDDWVAYNLFDYTEPPEANWDSSWLDLEVSLSFSTLPRLSGSYVNPWPSKKTSEPIWSHPEDFDYFLYEGGSVIPPEP